MRQRHLAPRLPARPGRRTRPLGREKGSHLPALWGGLHPMMHLDYCSHEAALYACQKWHYSRSLPPPPHVSVGVWEHDQFIGCVLFARGASQNLLKPYGLKPTEGGELVRVALDHHET